MSIERFERKYPLTRSEAHQLRAALRPYATLDPFSQRSPEGRYFVRSLYFDTSDYRAYAEKITGEGNRIKLRIRTYAESSDAADFVSVELKTRREDRVAKFGAHAPYAAYDRYEATGHFGSDDPVLIEFERLVHLGGLRPKLLVDYWREAFVPRDRSSPRITLDHDVRTAAADRLHPDAPLFFRSASLSRAVILEVKTQEPEPPWLRAIVRSFGLGAVPNSKYAQGVEQTQHDLWFRR